MKKTSAVAALFIICVVAGNFVNPSFAVDFTITVETDKLTYTAGETVTVSGNLTLNGGPVPDALIALQIEGFNMAIFRTLFTGTTPPELVGDLNEDGTVDIFDVVIIAAAFGSVLGDPNWDQRADIREDNIVDIFDMVKLAVNYGKVEGGRRGVRISDVFFAEATGNRVTTVTKGRQYWIWINVTNSELYPINSTIAFTVYDSNNVPIYALASSGEVGPGGPYYVMHSWTIPDNMELGIGRIYASAFSKEPKNFGYAQCLEKSSGFEVASALVLKLAGEAFYASGESPTGFATSFNIPASGASGNYTVYACSFYIYYVTPYIAFDTTNFEILP